MKPFLLFMALCAPMGLWADFQVIFVDGSAEYRAESASQWTLLKEGQKVAESGFVRTGEQSSLELQKDGKARMVFSANTLARLKFTAKGLEDRILIHTGKILTDVFTPGSSLQVRTGLANMGVRGTQFTVIANADGEAQVAVKEGSVFTLGKSDDGSASGTLVAAGQKSAVSSGEKPKAVKLQSKDADYFDFGAFADMKAGNDLTLFDHYSAEDDAFFQKFVADDLADYQLFVLDELDDQWQFFLKENTEFAKQLYNAPLKGKS